MNGRGFDDGKTRLRDIKKNLYKGRLFGIGADDPNATNIHDYEKALFWLDKAFQAGSLDAAEILAFAYLMGFGPPDEPGGNLTYVNNNCVGSIRRDRTKALNIIRWIEEREPSRAERLRSLIKD